MLALKFMVLSILACVFSVSALPPQMTNSKRLALGLPPLKPRKLFDAAHVDAADRSRRSIKADERATNAKRLALGLPPLKPRKLFDATHVDTAARSKRSLAANTQFTCYGYAACCLDSTGVSGAPASNCELSGTSQDSCATDEIAACCPNDMNDTGCTAY